MIAAKCSKEIDLSRMAANVLDSHAKGKKHCDIAKNCSAGLHCSFFRKTEEPAVSTAEKDSKEICKAGKTVKGKLDHYLLDDSTYLLHGLTCVVPGALFRFHPMFKDDCCQNEICENKM